MTRKTGLMMATTLIGGALVAGATAPAASADTTAVAAKRGTFGPYGYGGVKLGWSAKRAQASHKIVRKFRGGACSGWDLKAHRTGRDSVGLYISKKHGVALISAPKGVSTPRGIHIGSTLKQVKRAYPGVRLGDYYYVTVPGNRKATYNFLVRHGKVYELNIALKNQDCTN
ncbi:hypothetical protein J4573_34080 [Actinomadura barringtoniae]|uniref:Uncharacterized protein n=1 Tax=Actinomadura barringtoniae TaxID=1427535 RepID=A0A939PGD1_9ACTN|nr:hypothetical protein [Actinomadura barringtoniae]MBO2452160.1 hypothetical protein [Actinomadura barringtoniae]